MIEEEIAACTKQLREAQRHAESKPSARNWHMVMLCEAELSMLYRRKFESEKQAGPA